jgi:uncharacterized protein with PQ loop repeat
MAEMRRRRLPLTGALINLAGIGGLLGFYTVQAISVFVKRDVTGLSLPAFLLLFIGCVGLVGVSIRARSVILQVVNLVAAICTGATIGAIIAWH